MGMLTGLLTGFTARKGEYEKQQQEEFQAATTREARVFEALLNSPDPEIQAMAATGLLQTTQQPNPKKGLGGWLGEMQGHPAYGSILNLIKTPVAGTETRTTLQSRDQPQATAAPPTVVGVSPEQAAEASMAMPETAITSPNAPPPPAPRIYHGGTPYEQPVMKPRQVFQTRAGQLAEDARAKGQADIEGEVAGLISVGFTDKEARELIKQRLQRTASGLAEGNITPDPTSPTGYSQLLYDRVTGAPVRSIPAMNPAFGRAGGLGMERESLAREMGLPSASAATPAQMAQINQTLWERKARLLPSQILARVSTLFQGRTDVTFGDYLDAADALMTAQGPTLPGAAPMAPAPTGGIPGSIPLPETPPPAPGAAQAPAGPPAPVAPGSPEQTPPAASTPAATPPPPTSLRGKVTAAMPDSGKALIDTGKPLPPAAAMLVGRSEANNALIDHALEALKAGGWDQRNTLEDSMEMARSYRQGVYDPVTEAVSQLSDLAGLQTANAPALTQNAARAMQYFVQKRQHVPRLPGGRQTMAGAVLPAGAVQGASVAIAGDEAGFDTPAMMYQKLLKARENNATFIQAIKEAYTGPARNEAAPGTPPPTPKGTDTKAGPANLFVGADGELHVGSATGPLYSAKK